MNKVKLVLVKLLLVIVVVFSIDVQGVSAEDDYDAYQKSIEYEGEIDLTKAGPDYTHFYRLVDGEAVDDGCIAGKTCFQLCEYFHTYQCEEAACDFSKVYKNYVGIFISVDTLSSGLVSTWALRWESPNHGITQLIDTVQKTIFVKEKNVYIRDEERDELINYGICPQYGYINKKVSSPQVTMVPAVCFDSGDGWCKKQNGWGLDFTRLEYDFKRRPYAINETFESMFNNELDVISGLDCPKTQSELINFQNSFKSLNDIFNEAKANKQFIGNVDYFPGFLVPDIGDNSNNTKICSEQEEKKKPFCIGFNKWKDAINKKINTCKEDIGELDDGETMLEDIDEWFTSFNNKILEYIESFSGQETITPTNCEGILGGKAGEFLDYLYSIIKIIVPILLIILSMVDYAKSITKDDAEVLKLSNKKFVIRLAITVLIFILPTLINLLFAIFGFEGTCGIS